MVKANIIRSCQNGSLPGHPPIHKVNPAVACQEDVVGADIVVQQRLTSDHLHQVDLIRSQPFQREPSRGIEPP